MWVYILKSKDEAFLKFNEWKTLVEIQTGKRIKRLRTDNGLEYFSEEFNKMSSQNGIARHKTVRNTPQLNGLN